MSDIFLLPGEFYFGSEDEKIKTLLGSCVAITMWNSEKKVGGMCHYKLPRRLMKESSQLDGSYGDEAILLFLQSITEFMLAPEDMVVGVFGAGNMFSNIIEDDAKTIGEQNIRLALQLLKLHGFDITLQSLGGHVSRKLMLDLNSGAVKVQSLDVKQQKWL